MQLDKEHWKELDINVDSLWLIGARAKYGKHENVYHGNFAPQIPNNMIRRYTDEGDTVLDMFMGSGTTLYESEILKRNYIGFDINQEIIDHVVHNMEQSTNNDIFTTETQPHNGIQYFIHNCNIMDTIHVGEHIKQDLSTLGTQNVDLILSHPPYWDIIKFTDKPEDLSNATDINDFINKFLISIKNCYTFLKKGKYLVLVIGDVYKNSEVIPLGFYLMYAIKKQFNCLLKGIVVKDMVGNRGKIGQEQLWRYRALKCGNFLFKHEYIFVFKKL